MLRDGLILKRAILKRAILTRLILSVLPCLVALNTTASCAAQQVAATPEQIEFFEAKIRPALVKYCYQCHSLEESDSRAGLLVDTRADLLQGGDGGPAIVPGDLDGSLLWEAINYEGSEMPPSQPMPDEVIADFKTWIEMGAPDPRVRETIEFSTKISQEDIEDGKQHWAFQQPHADSGASIDQLVNEKLTEAGLRPVGAADAPTMLRRLNYDLVGLPPTPDEILSFDEAWDKDKIQAIESKVDELLERPQYGERWGRHWLDVARYADTSGNVNVTFPHAWRYRDYVINAFNKDTPYDTFISQQIAGDLLPAKTKEQWQENLIATGFLAVGMKRLDERNPRKFQADVVDEQIDTVSQSILGITVACARCHDHKTDPIPTTDYYALAGIFRSTDTHYGTVFGLQNHRPADLILLPILDQKSNGDVSMVELEQQMQLLNQRRQEVRAEAAETGQRVQRKFVQLRNTEARIKGQMATLNPDGTTKTYGMGVQDASEKVNANVLVGGDVDRPAQAVDRGFLQVLDHWENVEIPTDASGRRQLAQWLTSSENPLTARVMANRIWGHLLGTPLTKTSNNYGATGIKPSNQALLDYLAVSFVKKQWSVKSLIREIVLSDAYQRGSIYDARNFEVDPFNELLWRVDPTTLDAEALRDGLLAIGGTLVADPPTRSEVAELGDGRFGRNFDESSFNPNNRNRSVYLPIVRDKVNEALALFDFPDPNVTSSGRAESIVPTQALYLMNSNFVAEQAARMAVEMSGKGDDQQQIQWAFLTSYGRQATTEEVQSSLKYIKQIEPPKNFPSVARTTEAAPNQTRGKGGQRRQDGAMGNRRSGRRRQTAAPLAASDLPKLNVAQRRLAVFCQALLGSAEYRILN